LPLIVQLSPCGGAGRTVIAYETLVHSLKAMPGEEGIIIDISTDIDAVLPVKGCLAGYLYGKMHPADAMARVPGFTTAYYARLFSPPCSKFFSNREWSKLLRDVEELVGLLTMEVASYIERGAHVIITARFDLFTENFLIPFLSSPLIKKYAKIVFTGKEDKRCMSELFQLIEKINYENSVIFLNKIPAAEIINVREEVLRWATLRKLYLAVLLPLTKQLYYRDFTEYTSVLMRAQTNPHARTISEIFKRMLSIMYGQEKGGKLIALIGGLLSATELPGGEGYGITEETQASSASQATASAPSLGPP